MLSVRYSDEPVDTPRNTTELRPGTLLTKATLGNASMYSFMSRARRRSRSSVVKAVMLCATSCMLASRLVAVTMTSSMVRASSSSVASWAMAARGECTAIMAMANGFRRNAGWLVGDSCVLALARLRDIGNSPPIGYRTDH